MDVQIDGNRIRSEREKRAWSQEHLAGAAGIGVRTIQRIEATGVASYESARAVSAALDIPVAELRRDDASASRAAIDTGHFESAPIATVPAQQPRLRIAARWLGAGLAVTLLAGIGGFFLLHDYQQVRVLRTFEHWVTAPAPSTAQR
jgi:transcriptional regulator with XRE-family HTH domain